MNLHYELYKKYTKEPLISIYKHKIKSLLNLDEIFILNSLAKEALVIPIKETDWIVVQAFESIDIAKTYVEENNLKDYVEIEKLSINNFLLILEKLFFKGITGVLFNCDINGYKTVYISLPLLFNDVEDTLVKAEYQPIINTLVNTLQSKHYLHYIHHPSLNADEISIGIVKYVIRFDGLNNYIDLFESRELAEEYCFDKKIEKSLEDNIKKIVKDKTDNKEILSEIKDDFNKEKYPITTVMNNILFYSIKVLLEKEISEKEDLIKDIEKKKNENPKYELSKNEAKLLNLALNKSSNLLVKIHREDKVYKIAMDDFLQLIINVGFEQLDLS